MVGVPGRSKGCITCRKRKKGCDLAQPGCGQCEERGMKCGGYDSDRIFIYQASGSGRPLAKRDKSAAIGRPSKQPFRDDMQMIHSKVGLTLESCDSPPASASITLPDGFARSAYSEKTISIFLDMYNPAGIINTTNTDAKEFVTLLPLLSMRDEALQMAALAVGITQLGTTANDKNLARHGRTLYGRALKETGMALIDPARARSQSLLVVPRVMALYDMLFGAEPHSTSQAKSWLSHAEGELAMIVNRGPEAFAKDDSAHVLFTNARYRLLGPAIRGRKSTILNNEEWKTLPWKGRKKSSGDVLMDVLCGIPELLEIVDRLQFEFLDDMEREGLQIYTFSRCWTLHFQLQNWAHAEANAIYIPEFIDSTTNITFPDIDVACVTVRYWITAVFLYSCLDIASGIDISTDCLLSHPDRPHPRPFARMITRSVDYFLQEKFGVTGIMAIWFPLGNALFYMNRNREPDEEYIMTIVKLWSRPKLPSMMRDFLVSFRQTVELGTSIPIPLS